MKRAIVFSTFFLLVVASWAQTLRMNSNQRLDKGKKIEVAGKGYLAMQTDGNLVFYNADNAPKWATGTNGKAVTHAIMQGDGNLVVYNNSSAVWASGTSGVGANGGYLEINLQTYRVCIFKSNGALAKELAAASNSGSIIVDDPNQALRFPREGNWEVEMCKAMGIMGVAATYAGLTPFQKAISSLGLDAAEAHFATTGTPNIKPLDAMTKLKPNYVVESQDMLKVTGVLTALFVDRLVSNSGDPRIEALRPWLEACYRELQIRTAHETLKEYNVWKNNPCGYTGPGYTKPSSCYAQNQTAQALGNSERPPSSTMFNKGFQNAVGNNTKFINGITTAATEVGIIGAFAATASGLGVITNATVGSVTALFTAFGGSAGGGAGAAGIGAVSWGGVVAGPAAIISAAVIVGVTRGVELLEIGQVEPRLKQAIAEAVSGELNLVNIANDENQAAMLLIGIVKSSQNGWKMPALNAFDGEMTFFNEAGYVSKSTLTYTLNGQNKTFTTPNMSAGQTEKYTIPAAATNIKVRGVMISAGEHEIFSKTIAQPTYACYKVYGTVFKTAWSNDWPLGINSELANKNKITLTNGAGFTANWQVTYNLPGKPLQNFNPLGTTLGWTKTYDIPAEATNIRVWAQGATGLAWEPWRTTYDKTFPTPPSLCLKLYGTTLDQKWNTDCEL